MLFVWHSKLVKSRVRAEKGFARVGFKIRTNPTNEHPVTNVVIILAVPPDVDGEHCKASREGGSWEELKRTLTWCVPTLAPGEALEVQAQFPLLEQTDKGPKFPILVRCDFPTFFSDLEIFSKENLVKVNVCFSGRVMHRKV